MTLGDAKQERSGGGGYCRLGLRQEFKVVLEVSPGPVGLPEHDLWAPAGAVGHADREGGQGGHEFGDERRVVAGGAEVGPALGKKGLGQRPLPECAAADHHGEHRDRSSGLPRRLDSMIATAAARAAPAACAAACEEPAPVRGAGGRSGAAGGGRYACPAAAGHRGAEVARGGAHGRVDQRLKARHLGG